MTEVTEVPYIGEKTARELRRKGRGSTFNRTTTGPVTIREAASMGDGLLQVVLDTRQRRKLAEASGRAETAFLTTDERAKLASQQRDSGSTDPGDNIRRGDFRVDRDLFKEAREQHNSRSELSQERDENNRARITTDYAKWTNDPDSFDFPGVDTPNKRKPRGQKKDKPFIEEDDFLRDLEDL